MSDPPKTEWLPVAQIDPPRTPMRSEPGSDIAGLADSVGRDGLLNPILVRPGPNGRYELVYGHRRWLAHGKAGRETILCFVRDDLTDEDAAKLRAVENQHRKPVRDLDLIRYMKELRESYRYPLETIAELVDLSLSSVSERLSILFLPQRILDSYRAGGTGGLGLKHLVALAKLSKRESLGKAEELEWLWQKVLKHRTSKEETARIVKFVLSSAYARLPDKARELLLSDPHMTARHAELLVDPKERLKGKAAKAFGQFTDADRTRLAKQVCSSKLTVDGMRVRIEKLLVSRAGGRVGASSGAPDGGDRTSRRGDSRTGRAPDDESRFVVNATIEASKRLLRCLEDLGEALAQPTDVPKRLLDELRASLDALRVGLDMLPPGLASGQDKGSAKTTDTGHENGKPAEKEEAPHDPCQ